MTWRVPPGEFVSDERWSRTAQRGLDGDATAVAVTSDDRVCAFTRGRDGMRIYDLDGEIIDSWGGGEMPGAHALGIDDYDNLYLVDNVAHVVQKRTLSGEVLFELGAFGKPSPRHTDGYFNRPTDVSVDPRTGDIFVTDGYQNSRVHRFDAEGNHLLSWGEPGGGPGQFYLPHGLAVVDGVVMVCDRENFRVQVFGVDGSFVGQWRQFRPSAIRWNARERLLYVAELGPEASHHGLPHMGNRVVTMTREGLQCEIIGASTPGHGAGQLLSPHGMAFDSHGGVYIAETARAWGVGHLGLDDDSPEAESLSRWRRMTSLTA